jgi:hypothetical protein
MAIRASRGALATGYIWTAKVEGKIKGDGTNVPILLCLHEGYCSTLDFARRVAQSAKPLNHRALERAAYAGERYDTPLY